MSKLKPGFKIFLIAIAVFVIGFGVKTFWLDKVPADKVSGSKSSKSLSSLFGSKGEEITLGVNTYAGFMPFMYLNNGLKANEDCILYKEYGLKLNIVIQDDFEAGRAAFKNNDIDIIYCTADALPVEMSESGDMSDARLFNISNWSRGADAIVVNKNIRTVADLKGKKVACSEGTASHTLLINTLETNGIKPNEITLIKVGSGLDAAQAFKANQVDAAVVFAPDDADIVASISGSKVLVSTKQATNIICDCLIAKQSYLNENKETVTKLVSALLYANVEMNTNNDAVSQAAKAFAKAFGTDEAFAIDGSKNIRYATLEDEANFFGLNSSYTGVKGDELYSKMARTYEGLGLCKRPLSWRKVSDESIIEGLLANKESVKGDQSAEAKKTFTAPTKEVQTKTEISNKKLTINFPVNGDLLDSDARSLIDREFVGIAKEFNGARIRVVGECDATGNITYNLELSKRRAQAVVDYLVKEYGFDTNRFMVFGEGSKRAIADGVKGSNDAYRVTNFMLVSD